MFDLSNCGLCNYRCTCHRLTALQDLVGAKYNFVCFLSLEGTSQVGGFSQDTVLYALRDCGIHLIDTSKYNGFEVQLSEAIRESAVPRSDLWITNKLWPEDYGYETAKKAFQKSCSQMGVEYLGKE